MADEPVQTALDDAYEVTLTSVDKLSAGEIATCIDVVADGGAVSRAAARAGVPHAATLALVRHKGEIIGVGVIKAPNPQHARTVARESKHPFPGTTPELGYASVRNTHRDKHLSSRILDALLPAPNGVRVSRCGCDRHAGVPVAPRAAACPMKGAFRDAIAEGLTPASEFPSGPFPAALVHRRILACPTIFVADSDGLPTPDPAAWLFVASASAHTM